MEKKTIQTPTDWMLLERATKRASKEILSRLPFTSQAPIIEEEKSIFITEQDLQERKQKQSRRIIESIIDKI